MPDLVSILIPAYNVEALLAETVRSALNQTWPRTEIIIVDDGSSDATYDVARKFESRSVKVVRQENRGATAARNSALGYAQGDYIQWLDADDLLHPEKISRQLDRADGGAASRTFHTCSWGTFYFDTNRANFVEDSLWRDHDPVEWLVTKFSDNVWMNPTVWLASRELVEAAGPWDQRLARSNNDGEYVCRVLCNADAVKFEAGAKCYYRIGVVGSINWNKQVSEEGLKSLVLSLKLSIRHLLSLENSQRTRQASLQHLRAFLEYLYGCDDDYYKELRDFASDELDGHLEAPTVSWKYKPLEAVAGSRVTRNAITRWRRTKTLLQRQLEYRLARRQPPDA